jgi:tetratricopeptide (TPR) repeat protein
MLNRLFGQRRPLLAAFALFVPFLLAQEKPAGKAEILAQLRSGNNNDALSLARAALVSAPRDCSLLTLEGLAHNGLGQAQLALLSFESALKYCPTYLPALEGAAELEYAQGGTQAVALLQRILALKPDNTTAHAMLATKLRAQGKCADALAHYQASESLFPGRPDLKQGYGSCLAEAGDIREALAQYQELLVSNPQDAIRFDVAILQWRSHANDAALATLTPLLKGDHGVPALALSAKIHEEKGETPQAVDLLRQAILQSPDEVGNYVDFAVIAFAHSSFQVGIDMLDAGVKRQPNAAPLYIARGVLEVQLSRSDAALADFERAHRLDPKSSFAVDALGMMQSQQHNTKESLAFYETQAKRRPKDPFLQYLLAEQLSEGPSDANQERLTAAINAGKRALALDPSYVPAHDLLAVLYLRADQPQLAIQQAQIALSLDPNDQSALYQEILARRRAGDKDGQIAALTTRFIQTRRENAQRQQLTDRYQLQEVNAQTSDH